MTRTDDTFIALADRVSFARDRKAALFISSMPMRWNGATATRRVRPSIRCRRPL